MLCCFCDRLQQALGDSGDEQRSELVVGGGGVAESWEKLDEVAGNPTQAIIYKPGTASCA